MALNIRKWPLTNKIIAGLGVWLVLSFDFVAAVNLIGGKPNTRAVILMACGLIYLWVILGGFLMWRYRERVRAFVLALPWPWPVKFVLFCTLLACIEEAVTVTMTNMAPVFGVPMGHAYITASADYLDVITRHSVVALLGQFIGWSWMLSRWDFSAAEVLLLYGLTGTLNEVSFGGPAHFAEIGQWTFIYGLMVWLPAYCLPKRPRARRPRWYWMCLLYPASLFIPTFFAIPIIVPAMWHHPKMHFPPLVPNS